MKFVRQHWYDIGLGLAILTLAWQAFARYDGLQLILLLNLVVIFLHQFEEYRLPGGEPWILNEIVQPRGGPVDRYPLNQNNAAFINMMAWPFYLAPVILPGVIWLGIGQILFGMVGQVVVHGLQTNIKMKTFYNPGFAAVLLGHVPLGIWYLVEGYGQGVITGWDWLFGALYMIFFIVVIMLVIGYRILVSKTSPYPFTAEELDRFDRAGHLRRAGVTPLPLTPDDAPSTQADPGASQ